MLQLNRLGRCIETCSIRPLMRITLTASITHVNGIITLHTWSFKLSYHKIVRWCCNHYAMSAAHTVKELAFKLNKNNVI